MSAHLLPYPVSSLASCHSNCLEPPLPRSAHRPHSPSSSGSLYRPCAGFSVRSFSHAHTKLTRESVYKTNKCASRLKATAGHARLWLLCPLQAPVLQPLWLPLGLLRLQCCSRPLLCLVNSYSPFNTWLGYHLPIKAALERNFPRRCNYMSTGNFAQNTRPIKSWLVEDTSGL